MVAPGKMPKQKARRQRRSEESFLLRAMALGLLIVGGSAIIAYHALQSSTVGSQPQRSSPYDISQSRNMSRQDQVKAAVLSAWQAYERFAWSHDELAPLAMSGKDSFGGFGATLIDSLDTLYLLGLHDEYRRAATWALTKLDIQKTPLDMETSAFEVIIRIIGGLIGAYELSGDKALIWKAQEVADVLMPIYATPTGIPFNIINVRTGKAHNDEGKLGSSALAEFGTHQMEFLRLSQLTGNQTYAMHAEASIRFLRHHWPRDGLKPLYINPIHGNFTTREVSFGALGDSYYEYLLKIWILKKHNPQYDCFREMWVQAMDAMLDRLVFTNKYGITYIAEFSKYSVRHRMDHLACFVPGMLILGIFHNATTGNAKKARRYRLVAEAVAETCFAMYNTTLNSGLSPEYVTFLTGTLRPGHAVYYQRPEAVESFWYLWRYTGDEKYREWGWKIFEALMKHCRVEESGGFASIKHVGKRKEKLEVVDIQQSFLISETFKYLWLLFSDDESVLDFDQYVLNTEAHPIQRGKP